MFGFMIENIHEYTFFSIVNWHLLPQICNFLNTVLQKLNMNTLMVYFYFMGTNYFLWSSLNILILCYAKQLCFLNALHFMAKPVDPGLDRVFLSESKKPRSLFLSPVHSVSSAGSLEAHLGSYDTTNTTNGADPNPQLKLNTEWQQQQTCSCLYVD